MPMKLNVGLSRKIGEANYGSRGANINVEMEVESALITEPARLQERIRQLFGLVRKSLDEELNGNTPNPGAAGSSRQQNQGNGAQTKPRAATQSQVKALYAIARNRRLDLVRILQERFQLDRPESLSLPQASQLIDELKNGE